MKRVFLAESTVLADFHPVRMFFLILCSCVISVLTLCTFQRYPCAHGYPPPMIIRFPRFTVTFLLLHKKKTLSRQLRLYHSPSQYVKQNLYSCFCMGSHLLCLIIYAAEYAGTDVCEHLSLKNACLLYSWEFRHIG